MAEPELAEPEPAEPEPAFYAGGLTVIESLVAASFIVVMLWLSLRVARKELLALGLTMVMASGFLGTPKLLSNSVLRRAEARQLQRLVNSGPDGGPERVVPSNAVVAFLLGLALIAVALEVTGVVVESRHRTPSSTGAWLFGAGEFACIVAFLGTWLWRLTTLLTEALLSDARETEGRVLASSPDDRLWPAALVLFLGGTVLQFVDALNG